MRKKKLLILTTGTILLILGILIACAEPPSAPKLETPIPQTHKEESTLPPSQNEATITVPVSPQISKIAFVRNFGSYYGYDICTMDSDGTNIQRLTNSPSVDLHPSWSPDGTKIAFVSIREWHNMSSVYVMDIDGKNVKCLTTGKQFCKLPTWSPDGKKIAYCAMVDVGYPRGGNFIPGSIFIMNSDGSDKEYAFSGWSPSWLPDSQHIAYLTGSWEIRTANIDSSDTKSYCPHINSYCTIRFQIGEYPTLVASPDGNSIAFDYRDYTGRQDIYVMPFGGDAKCLTCNLQGNCYNPTWSPDSSKVAFTMETERKVNPETMGTEKETAIYVIDADGNNPTMLIENGAYPSWQKGEIK